MSILLAVISVVGPSLLLSAVIRRWLVPLPWRIVACALLLSIGFTSGSLLTHEIGVPLDDVARTYPYRALFGDVHRGNGLTNDTVHQMLPWMEAVREQFARGEWPLWNPYSFSGYPLLGNGQSAPFSPFFLVTLLVPLPKQLAAMAALKLFVSFLFTYLFLKDDERSDGAALFGAASFAFSVFETVYLYYPLTAVTSLLPMLLWSVRRCRRFPQWRWAACVAATTAAALAGGHPESVLHLALGAALLLLIDARTAVSRLGALARLASSVAIGVALAAPAWVPTAEQVFVSHRFAAIEAAGHVMSRFRFPGIAAWILVNPNGFGNPARGDWRWIGNYSMVAPTYFGLLLLALAIAALVSRSGRHVAYAAVACLLLVAAMNWTKLGELLNAMPPLSIASNDRLRVVALFFAIAAGAYVLDRLERFTKVAFVATACVCGAAAIRLLVLKLGSTLHRADITGVAVLTLFVVAVLFAPARICERLPLVAACCAVVELFTFNVGFNVPVPERLYKPRLAIVDALRRLMADKPSRFVGFDWVMMPNASAQYGLEDIRGSDPMATEAYVRFLAPFAVDDPAVDVKRIQRIDQPALAFLNVRYVMTEPGFTAPAGWVQRYAGPDGELYESPNALDRFFVPRLQNATIGPIARPSSSEFRFTATAAAPAFIASSQPAARGWEVAIDGHRVSTRVVNGAFLGFTVPAGTSHVIVRYRPSSFRYALLASTLAAAVTILALLRPLVLHRPLHVDAELFRGV